MQWKGDAQSSVDLNGKSTLIMTKARRSAPLRTWYGVASPTMWSCCLSAVLQRLVSSCLFSSPLSNDDFHSNFTDKIKVSRKELLEIPNTILSSAPTPYSPLIPPWSHSLRSSHAVLTPLLLHRPPQHSSNQRGLCSCLAVSAFAFSSAWNSLLRHLKDWLSHIVKVTSELLPYM